jgi:mono/diheme cytochrome c family protein
MLLARRFLFLAVFCASLAPAQATYSKEIARIFQASCQQCHREGDIAPFALDSYDAALRHAADIQRVLALRTMPPWKPVAGFGEFRDSFQISDDDRQTILDWIMHGMPQGDPADLPDAAPVKGPWPLGTPDLSLAMLQPYTPAIGGDVYRCFIIPTGLNETTYLSAIDVSPGARQVVHHVLLFQDNQGVGQDKEYRDGQPGYPCFGGPGIAFSLNNLTAALGGWAPGQRTQFLPDGVGIQLQKGANIIMQVHYHPHGGTAEDQTRIGLYFSKTPVKQRLFQVPILNQQFTIPPGEERYEVNAAFPVLPFLDAKAIWVYPHMHLLGKDIKADVVNPDQSVTPLIWEDRWDFNYQGAYTFKDQLAIKAGSMVRVKCTYDNSSNNLLNPNDPPVPVSWGEATTDEMCLAFIGVTLDYERFLPLGPLN